MIRNTNLLKIGMTLDECLICKEIISSLPQYHCFRGFLEDCVAEFEKKYNVYKAGGFSDVPYGFAMFGIETTNQTIGFLKTKEAENILQSNPVLKTFSDSILSQLTLPQLKQSILS